MKKPILWQTLALVLLLAGAGWGALLPGGDGTPNWGLIGFGVAVLLLAENQRVQVKTKALEFEIQERKRAEERAEAARAEAVQEKSRLEAVMQSLPVGVAILDSHGGDIRANRTFKEVWGGELPATRSVNDYGSFKAWWVETGESVQAAEWASAQAVRDGQKVVGQLMRIQRFDGTSAFVLNSAAPILTPQGQVTGCAVAIQDITQRIESEQALQRLNRTLKALRHSSQAMTRTSDEQAYLDEVCQIVVEYCRHAMVWVGLAEDDESKSVRPVAYSGLDQGYVKTLNVSWAETERGRGPTGTAIRTGKPVICQDMRTDSAVAPWRAEALKRGFAASVALPLRAQGKAFGAITIYSTQLGSFSEEEVQLLCELADDLAHGLGAIRLRSAHAVAESKLRESQQQYQRLFNMASDGVVLNELSSEFDQSCFLESNEAICRLLGYSAEQMRRFSPLDIMEPVDMQTFLREREVLRQEGALLHEKTLRCKDGRKVLAEISTRVFEHHGRKMALSTIRDITERKRAQLQLEQQAATLREQTKLLDLAHLVARDLDDRIILWTLGAEKLYGWSKQEALGRISYQQLNTRFPVPRHAIQAALFKDGFWEGELIQTRKDGTSITVLSRWELYRNEQGTPVAILESNNDVSVTKQVEAALRESEARFSLLFQQAAIGIKRLDPQGTLLEVNDQLCQILGYSRQQLVGFSLKDFTHPEDLPEESAQLCRLFAQEIRTYSLEKRCLRADGAVIWLRVTNSLPLRGENEPSPAWAISVVEDITARKRAEQLLQNSNERLDLLAETASKLLKSESPQQVVNGLCEKVMSFLDCQVFFNFLVDEEQKALRLNACAGIPAEEANRIEWLNFGTAVCGCVAQNGARIVAENIPENPDPRTELVSSYGVKAYACHPLVSHGQVLGTLSFGTRTRTRFSADELSLMKAVADQVAIAMERLRAKQALLKANTDLEKRVARRTAQLREQSRFLEAFFEHSLDSLVFLDRDFNFIRVNAAYARACGRDPAEFPGRNHFELYPNSENKTIFENVVRTKTPFMVTAKPFSFPDHPEWGVSYWDWTLVPVLNTLDEVDFLVLSLRDVTTRQRAEDEVRAASRYVRSLLEASLDPLVTISPAGQITDVNRATETVTGCDRDRLIGSDFSDYFTESEQAREVYRKVIAEGFVRDYPLTVRHSSGSHTEVLYNASVYRNEAGEIQGVFAAARDVTERKQMEAILRQSEERYRSLVSATAQLVWTTNANGEVVERLPSWCAFTGQTFEQSRGWGWSQAVHPEDLPHTQSAWTRAVAERTPYEIEYRLRRYDGEYRHMSARGVPVCHIDGQVREWVGACTDISERKEAERRRNMTNALLELFAKKSSSKEYLDSVVQLLQVWTECEAIGVRVLDDQNRLCYQSCNGFDEPFLTLERSLCPGQDNCICLRALAQRPEPQERELFTLGGSFRCNHSSAFMGSLAPEQRADYRGNCVRWGFESVAVVPVNYRDQVLGVIHLVHRKPHHFSIPAIEFIESMAPLIGEAIQRFRSETELAKYRDQLEELVRQRTGELQTTNAQLQTEIAERTHAEVALRQTAQELVRSNRDLEQFAYVASHDLQEPLRAVSGFVQLLQHRFQDKLDAKGMQYIAEAVDGAARMQVLIHDLLAFSRVGTQGRTFEPTDLNLAFEKALLNLKASIKEANAIVRCDPLPSLRVDGSQIAQLFQNLIGNGIKFRSDRSPEIHVRVQHQTAQGRWLFTVQDNGIGIEPQYFERIFQIFQRLHTRRRYTGTGIGLAICKKIVERHGGTIWVESLPQQGSTFFFTLADQTTTPQS